MLRLHLYELRGDERFGFDEERRKRIKREDMKIVEVDGREEGGDRDNMHVSFGRDLNVLIRR